MRLVILCSVVGLGALIGCAAVNSPEESNTAEEPFVPLEYPVERLFLTRCDLGGLDSLIKQTDFCFIGETILTNHLTQPLNPNTWRCSHIIEGRIEVQSVIYGNLKIKQIPYSYEYGDNPGPLQSLQEWIIWVQAIPWIGVSGPPENGKIIALGRQKEQNIESLYLYWVPVISPKGIKLIKELEDIGKDDFQKQKAEILKESNDIELLSYLFRRSRQESTMEERIKMLEVLSAKDKITPERRWLSYGFTLYLIYQPTFYSNNEYEINDFQRQRLTNIITERLSEIQTVKEGIKYLKLIDTIVFDVFDMWRINKLCWSPENEKKYPPPPTVFQKIPILKEEIKKIADNLSRKFKADKDYPEWAAQVQRIFPAETPGK